MKKIERAEQDLWKVLEKDKETATERQFIKNLSEWIIKYFGNVNVAQRLNILSISCGDKVENREE